MKRRKLSKSELERILTQEQVSDTDESSAEDPFGGASDSDEDFNPEPLHASTSESSDCEKGDDGLITMEDLMEAGPSCQADMAGLGSVIDNVGSDLEFTDPAPSHQDLPPGDNRILWGPPPNNFEPRLSIPAIENPTITSTLQHTSTEFEIFKQLFPKSLWIFITQCTNSRLDIFQQTGDKNVVHADVGEMMVVIACTLIMSYNRLPSFNAYWSKNPSLGNAAIKAAISRDRCKLLMSKLYFNDPNKPEGASKIYYIEEVVSCFKQTFQNCRSDSSRQSIDESMTKFKGRSTLKQYMPLKPVKRGIKIWQRCDALSGYTYDMNIYCGKETTVQEGTLGERVVLKLANTIKKPQVSLCFDRFFTSVHLIDTIEFPAVGTCIQTRKNVPKTDNKLKYRGDMEILTNTNGTLFVKWRDTKDVYVLSNCHSPTVSTIQRKQKNGEKLGIPCPDSIAFYNAHMGGVDMADQMSTLYDLDRKSAKWWKKVFYKLLMSAVVNAWVIQNDLRRKKIPLLDFLVPLAEAILSEGRKTSKMKRKRSYGRPSNTSKELANVGDHLPIEGLVRRRCVRCSQQKRDRRTRTTCAQCSVPLCKFCFTPYHT